MPATLAEALFDLLVVHWQEALRFGWGQVAEWVFPSEVDLGFASFGASTSDGAKRLQPAPNENGAGDELANPAKRMVELRGIEPLTLRLPA